MKFLQELDDEKARFESVKAQHEQACLQAKRNMLEKIRTFAKEHYLKDVLVDENQRKIYGKWEERDSSCNDITRFLGRYFTVEEEPTNLYIARKREEMCPCYMIWSNSGGKRTITVDTICFEEENPRSLEELSEKVKREHFTSVIRSAPTPLFVFQDYDKITTGYDINSRKYFTRSKHSGSISGINFTELGISVKEYSALVDSLFRKKPELDK